MEAEHNRRYIDHELEPLKADVRDIKVSVHSIQQSKQERIKPAVIVTIVVYLISQLLIGVWWASETSTRLDNVLQGIQSAGKDRFYGKDGEALKTYMDLNIEILKKTLESLNNNIIQHNLDSEIYKRRIDNLQLEQTKIQQQLIRLNEHLRDEVHRKQIN